MSTGKGFQLYFMFEIFHLEKEREKSSFKPVLLKIWYA